MSALTSAWQAALTAEHRAVFGYGLLGAHLHGSPQLPLAISCSDAHEALRDGTVRAIAAAGLTPAPPAADYGDLYPVNSAKQAAPLAVRVEDDCAAAWRFLYSVAAATRTAQAKQLRPAAQTALTASAVRATQWRLVVSPAAATVAFPGT